jgi:hypothetical protein
MPKKIGIWSGLYEKTYLLSKAINGQWGKNTIVAPKKQTGFNQDFKFF